MGLTTPPYFMPSNRPKKRIRFQVPDAPKTPGYIPNQREDILNRNIPTQPYVLEALPRKVLSEEYERLRKQAREDIRALKDSEFSKAPAAQYYSKKFTRGASKMNKRELSRNISELNRFFRNPLTSVQGQVELKSRTIDTLNKRYGRGKNYFSNPEFYSKFVAVMDKLAEYYVAGRYSMEELIDLINSSSQVDDIVDYITSTVVDDL